MKRLKLFISMFLVLVLLTSTQIQSAFASINISEIIDEDISETAITTSSNVTDLGEPVVGLNGIYVLTNRGNYQAIQNNGNTLGSNTSSAVSVLRSYATHSQLIKIVPFEGIPSMGLPGGTYLIESVSEPYRYLDAQSDSNAYFRLVASFPVATMLWYITMHSNGTYRIYPYSNSAQALCAPMTLLTGYSPYLAAYNSDNAYMQWDLKPNYSWYSQKNGEITGWESGVFNNANNGAITLDDLTFAEGLYAGESLLDAINAEGCHLCSIAMILANMLSNYFV